MRKHLLFFSLLVLLSLTGLGGAQHLLHQEGQAVEFTETTLQGDFAQAQGLRAELHAQSGYQLFWDMDLPLTGTPETELWVSPKPQHPSLLPRDQMAYLNFELDFHYNGFNSPMESELTELSPLLQRIVDALEPQLKPGGKVTRTFPMEDFLDAYPSHFSIQTQALRDERFPFRSREWAEKNRPDSLFLYDLNEAFRFPLLPGEYILASGTANKAGQLSKLDVNTTLDRQVDVSTRCCSTADTLYFLPELRLESGQLLDYSHTPKGYGVYALPASRADLTNDDLRFVCSLEEDCSVRDMAVSGDGQSLFAIVTDTNSVELRRINLGSGETTQVFPLPQDQHWLLFCEDDGVLVSSYECFRFYSKENGSYQECLTGTFPETTGDFFAGAIQSMAWDGDKLALLSIGWNRENNLTHRPLYLLISDWSGTCYAGTLESSLDRCQYRPLSDEGPLNYWEAYCGYREPNPCKLTWT